MIVARTATLLASVLAAIVAPAAFGDDVVTQSFEAAAIKRLVLDNGSGEVRVQGGDGRTATVTAKKVKFDDGCRLDIALDHHELKVTSKEPTSLLGAKECRVDITVELPRQVALDLRIGSGDVHVAAIKGNVTYKLGSGDLELKDCDVVGLDGKSGSGDVKIAGTVQTAELKLGAGNADITLTRAPQVGRLDVKVGTGSATIKLPKDAKIRSHFKAGVGSLTNELGDAPDAKFVVSGSAGAGDMTIRRL